MAVARIYAFAVDQTAAAALTNLALTVVTLTTSLLIVMGFSVPAAIASWRIRERWLAEDQIRYLAMHDSLTGLPNRLQLRQHLDRAVARAKRHGHLMAVFCLDLDRFKDVLGHAHIDAAIAWAGQNRAVVLDLFRRHVLALVEIELGIDALDLGGARRPREQRNARATSKIGRRGLVSGAACGIEGRFRRDSASFYHAVRLPPMM